MSAVLGGDLSGEVDSEDRSEDVGDDVMEEETLVGDEESHKGHKVRVDTGVHQNLKKRRTEKCKYCRLRIFHFR